MSNRLPGNVLGLEIDDNFVSCETSCEFSFEQDLRGASAIDSGRWKETIQGVRSWSISLNAAMLIASSPADAYTILNAFLTGSRMKIRFRTKFTGFGSFMIVGYVNVQNGGVSAAVNTSSSWNTTLQGDGPFSLTDTEQLQAFYGYRMTDPYNDEANLIPQFSKFFDDMAISISFDFTTQSAGNYLFAKVPTGQRIFNVWENNQFNFGDVPDFAWREVRAIGGFDYYISRSPLFITSAVPVITFKYKNIIPDTFSFTAVIDALLSTVYESNEVSPVNNITEPIPISITGGEYSFNGGVWTSVAGFIPPLATVKVRQTSSASYSTLTSTILNIGSNSASFDVTTTAPIGNDARTQDFRRNNCATGSIGSMVSYTVNADVYFSDTKEKANLLRDTTFDVDGQDFANDPANGGTCTIADVRNFTMAQDLRWLRLTANDGPITCPINLNVIYTVTSGGITGGESSRIIYLPSGQGTVLNNGGSITTFLGDTINIISFTFTPQYCSDEIVRVNGQGGQPDIE